MFKLRSLTNTSKRICNLKRLNVSPFISQRSFAIQTTVPVDKLIVKKTEQPKTLVDEDKLIFGRNFSDHMLLCEWTIEDGWKAPMIEPVRDLKIHPAASVLHYALECFEGMKAYVDKNGKVRLFRPEENMKRMSTSADRLCFPDVDQKAFLQLLEKLVLLDKRFIPKTRGYSLYIRPTMIATTPWLGVGPTTKALFYVLLSPVGPYYPKGFKPVQLLAEKHRVRASPGGVGAYKLGANYAPTILPQVDAAKEGYSQVLWLWGPQHELTEVGTMNLFIFWVNENGKRELVTPPLDGSILPGVTRDSVLQLTREWNEFEVVEKKVYMADFIKASEEGRIIEMFGAGTACVISPIDLLSFDGVDYKVPLDANKPDAVAGELSQRLFDTITSIQYGEQDHKWSKVLD